METEGVATPWNRGRTAALGLVLVGVAAVTGKVLLWETVEPTRPVEVQLPEVVPLENWQATQAEDLTDQNPEKPSYRKGREYRYQQGNSELDIQARYFVGTNGNVRVFINSYRPAELGAQAWEPRQLDETGSFLMLVEPSRIQISSCINPYGKSTITARAYKRNRNFQDIRYRLIPWLLGESLKDERCLWTHMSITKDANSSKEVIDTIENAWSSWYQWWAIHLPGMGK